MINEGGALGVNRRRNDRRTTVGEDRNITTSRSTRSEEKITSFELTAVVQTTLCVTVKCIVIHIVYVQTYPNNCYIRQSLAKSPIHSRPYFVVVNEGAH